MDADGAMGLDDLALDAIAFAAVSSAAHDNCPGPEPTGTRVASSFFRTAPTALSSACTTATICRLLFSGVALSSAPSGWVVGSAPSAALRVGKTPRRAPLGLKALASPF